jgi:acetyl-CoA C-acetyltransferase
MIREALICEPVRTPVGRFGGAFKDIPAHVLGATVLRGLLDRTGLPPGAIEDVIFAQCYPSMEAPALGRVVGLDAGLPIDVGGLQLDRRCGSGLQAVIYATMQVATGASDLVLAGGAESMSNAPFFTTAGRFGVRGEGMMLHDSLARGRVTAGGANYPVPGGMLETAENLRRDYEISRDAQDRYACESHRRAVAAQAAGCFADEIIPVIVPGRNGDSNIDTDEHPRPDVTAASLAALKPILLPSDPAATVTAGNASGQNDAASVCIVATREMAERHGLRVFGRMLSWAVAGTPPNIMGIGPVPATAKALARAGLTLAQIDLLEVNEAFAAQVLACTRAWNFAPTDFERLNVNGSGISLGHPVGATGGRILATLLREMSRRESRYGLETMCIGGGQGLAAIFERVPR